MFTQLVNIISRQEVEIHQNCQKENELNMELRFSLCAV